LNIFNILKYAALFRIIKFFVHSSYWY